MDLDHPINCSGVITSLQFCFYTSNTNSDDGDEGESTDDGRQMIYFRLFHYDPVEDTLRLVYTLDKMFQLENTGHSSFSCINHYYDENEIVDVYEGDHMAVYLPSLSRPLYVVGKNIPGMTLYKDTRSRRSQFYSTTLEKTSLMAVDGMAIHISADIGESISLPIKSCHVLFYLELVSQNSGTFTNALLPLNRSGDNTINILLC